MAEPKKKLSRTRSNRKRSLYQKKLSTSIIECSKCGELTFAHRVCGKCGNYRGVSIKQLAPTKRILLEEDKKTNQNVS